MFPKRSCLSFNGLKNRADKKYLFAFVLIMALVSITSGCLGKNPSTELIDAFKKATQTHTPTSTERPTQTPTITRTSTPTITPTETPTPTEKPLIEGNIFYDPQSKEDFKNVVLAPSPIDKPEEFAK
ncbi:MAG: hypothetical protein AAGU04_03440 [Anaerolineaceae bacterium]